jgi:hypothetical protein
LWPQEKEKTDGKAQAQEEKEEDEAQEQVGLYTLYERLPISGRAVPKHESFTDKLVASL